MKNLLILLSFLVSANSHALTAHLTWTDDSPIEAYVLGYIVYKNDVSIAQTVVTNYDDVESAVGDCYQVQTYNLNYVSDRSNTACLQTASPTVPPNNPILEPVEVTGDSGIRFRVTTTTTTTVQEVQ